MSCAQFCPFSLYCFEVIHFSLESTDFYSLRLWMCIFQNSAELRVYFPSQVKQFYLSLSVFLLAISPYKVSNVVIPPKNVLNSSFYSRSWVALVICRWFTVSLGSPICLLNFPADLLSPEGQPCLIKVMYLLSSPLNESLPEYKTPDSIGFSLKHLKVFPI